MSNQGEKQAMPTSDSVLKKQQKTSPTCYLLSDAGVFTFTATDGAEGLEASQVLVHRRLFQKRA